MLARKVLGTEVSLIEGLVTPERSEGRWLRNLRLHVGKEARNLRFANITVAVSAVAQAGICAGLNSAACASGNLPGKVKSPGL